jgi:hypothetical protein
MSAVESSCSILIKEKMQFGNLQRKIDVFIFFKGFGVREKRSHSCPPGFSGGGGEKKSFSLPAGASTAKVCRID